MEWNGWSGSSWPQNCKRVELNRELKLWKANHLVSLFMTDGNCRFLDTSLFIVSNSTSPISLSPHS